MDTELRKPLDWNFWKGAPRLSRGDISSQITMDQTLQKKLDSPKPYRFEDRLHHRRTKVLHAVSNRIYDSNGIRNTPTNRNIDKLLETMQRNIWNKPSTGLQGRLEVRKIKEHYKSAEKKYNNLDKETRRLAYDYAPYYDDVLRKPRDKEFYKNRRKKS